VRLNYRHERQNHIYGIESPEFWQILQVAEKERCNSMSASSGWIAYLQAQEHAQLQRL
jgi:hypothetical protein